MMTFNAVIFDSSSKTLTAVNHQRFPGPHVRACSCGHPQCTGYKAGALTIENVDSEEEGVALLLNPPDEEDIDPTTVEDLAKQPIESAVEGGLNGKKISFEQFMSECDAFGI